jgi:hypothetical protein
VGLNRTHLILSFNMQLVHLNVHILASTSVPFRSATVRLPNLAQIETKRISAYIVIHFVSFIAKFGICTVVDLNGTHLILSSNMQLVHLNVRILASTSVAFRPTMVQMPNLALIETKRITVYAERL